ncbi:unnamed protein product [Ilex paraguariensis]|uniref:Uncharacterized protein n=1 Tax=Ilex paraguariensis TaxID=185542 RepID=A0ABC8TYQ8_9AQUA
MGLHLVVLAKLKLITTTYSVAPMVACLAWPFVLKLLFSVGRLGPLGRVYDDVLDGFRFFLFQMGQITFNAAPASGNSTRWERALRLVRERVAQVSHSPALESDESWSATAKTNTTTTSS